MNRLNHIMLLNIHFEEAEKLSLAAVKTIRFMRDEKNNALHQFIILGGENRKRRWPGRDSNS